MQAVFGPTFPSNQSHFNEVTFPCVQVPRQAGIPIAIRLMVQMAARLFPKQMVFGSSPKWPVTRFILFCTFGANT